jgi:hypothetical protein
MSRRSGSGVTSPLTFASRRDSLSVGSFLLTVIFQINCAFLPWYLVCVCFVRPCIVDQVSGGSFFRRSVWGRRLRDGGVSEYSLDPLPFTHLTRPWSLAYLPERMHLPGRTCVAICVLGLDRPARSPWLVWLKRIVFKQEQTVTGFLHGSAERALGIIGKRLRNSLIFPLARSCFRV